MPRFNSFGGASAAAFRSGGHVAALYISSAEYHVGGPPITIGFGGGAQAGDLAIVGSVFVGVAGGSPFNYISVPVGWTEITHAGWPVAAYPEQVFYKVLSAGDIASGVAFVADANSGGQMWSAVYRGATVAAVTGGLSGTVGGPTLAIPGYLKLNTDALYVSYCVSRNAPDIIVKPPGFVTRINNPVATFFTMSLADAKPQNYGSGNNVVWSFSPGGSEVVGQVLRLS